MISLGYYSLMPSAAHIRYQSKLFRGSSHSWALRTLLPVSTTARVLDIGPGSGVIGRALKDRGFGDLSAVEIDAAARAHVQSIYSRVSADLTDFTGQKYDVILLLDVIEHMAEPEKFLATISNMLAPGGMVLVSVPNIAHWSVRFQLLFGFFCYTERGLLDKTHLQFFTRSRVRRFNQVVPALGCAEFDSSISPAELVLPIWMLAGPLFEIISRVRQAIARCLPGLCAYQHLAVFRNISALSRG